MITIYNALVKIEVIRFTNVIKHMQRSKLKLTPSLMTKSEFFQVVDFNNFQQFLGNNLVIPLK